MSVPGEISPAITTAGEDSLHHFTEAIACLGLRNPRVIGLWMMRFGMGGFLPALCTGPAAPNICFALAAAGFLLLRPPLRMLHGLSIGLLFTTWIGLSAVIVGRIGDVPRPMIGLGLSYTWIAAMFAQVAFTHRLTLYRSLQGLTILVFLSTLLAAAQFTFGLGSGPLHLDRHGLRHVHGVGFHALHLTQGPVMAMFAILLLAAGQVALLPRLWSWTAAALASVAVLLTAARMAYLGLAAGVGCALAVRGGRHVLTGVAAAIGLLLVTGSALLLWQPHQFQLMVHGQDGRWPIWRTSLSIVRAHPWFGSGGPEGFKIEYNWRFLTANPGATNEFARGGAPHAHNSLLSIGAEHGIPAILLYGSLLGTFLLVLWRRRAQCPTAWSLAMSVTAIAMVAGMFENLAGHSVPALTLFVILGIAISLPVQPVRPLVVIPPSPRATTSLPISASLT